MSTLNPTRKISRRQELREDKVVTFYAWAIDLFENNRTMVYGAAAAVALVVLGFVALGFYRAAQETEALNRMSTAVRLYEAGNYQAAVNGSDAFMGLAAVADQYGSTDSGNMARFYAADAMFRLGDYDGALPLFRAFDKGPNIVSASALAGEAAILEGRGEAAEAADLYRRAASIFPSDVTSPAYLMSAGNAYEAAGDRTRARRVYEEIRDDYPESQQARDIAFFLARTEG